MVAREVLVGGHAKGGSPVLVVTHLDHFLEELCLLRQGLVVLVRNLQCRANDVLVLRWVCIGLWTGATHAYMRRASNAPRTMPMTTLTFLPERERERERWLSVVVLYAHASLHPSLAANAHA